MKSQNWTLNKALRHCQSCRPIVNPNAGFAACLREWDAERRLKLSAEENKAAREAERLAGGANEEELLEEELKAEMMRRMGMGKAAEEEEVDPVAAGQIPQVSHST